MDASFKMLSFSFLSSFTSDCVEACQGITIKLSGVLGPAQGSVFSTLCL